MKAVLVTAAGLAMAGTAAAEPEWFGAVGYTAYDDGDFDTISAATVRGGVTVTPNLGFEVDASFGIDGAEAAGAEIEIGTAVSGYIVGRLPVSPQVDVLGRAGYGTIDFDVSGFGGSGSIDVNGFALGVGGEFKVNDRLSIRADYTRFEADDDQIDGGINTYGIAIVLRT